MSYRVVIIAGGCLFIAANAPAQAPADLEFFEKRVRPALVEHCHKCHGAEKQKAHLRLDSRAALHKGGDNGPVIVPGDIAKSRLVTAIRYTDPDLRMPPRGKLPDNVIEDLIAWVKMGAPWPDDAGNQKLTASKEFDLKARSRHWSLQPLQRHSPPLAKGVQGGWIQSPIDAFILAKLTEKGLAPAAPADPRTFIRRVYFDLIGLPPTPKEVDEFVRKCAGTHGIQRAHEELVDHLLATPHYGERWARHWLDLVRYAETQGHEFDFEIADAWKYRDYVIRALNADLPYDQFVREHIAGDLVPKPRRSQTGMNESILGTGFWWLGEAKHSPVDSRADQADRIDNQIDVFGKTFLGMTIACARCHDHKFDAISAKDYYALAGYLQSSRQEHVWLDDAAKRRPMIDALQKHRIAIQAEVSALHFPAPPAPVASRLLAFHGDTWGDWLTAGEAFGRGPSGKGDVMIRADAAAEPLVAVPPGLAHSGLVSLKLDGALRSPTFVIQHKRIHYRIAGKGARVQLILNGLQLIRDPIYGGLKFSVDNEKLHWRTQDVSMWIGQRAYIEVLDDGPGYAVLEQVAFNDDAPPVEPPGLTTKTPLLTDANRARVLPLVEEFRKAEAALPPTQRALGTIDGSAVNEHVFIRGNAKNLGEVVPRRHLEVFSGARIAPPHKGSGRLALAAQLVDPAQTPIVPRVIVNRVWKHHFGEGLVRSTDDFGVLGQAPSHPELLDYLATEFIKNGWSLKKLHKMIVLSSTYQQTSSPKASAANLGGQIDPDNRLLWRFPVRRLEAEAIRDAMLAVSGRLDRTTFGPSVPVHLTPFMVGRGRPGASGPLDGNGRRSIYLAVRRNFLNPMFVAFDYPTPFSTIGRRSVSNVPAQALTMLNNPFVLQQAELWAKKTLAEPGVTPAERVTRMYEASLSRPPLPGELADALAFLDEQARAHGRPDDIRAWAELAHVLFNVKEFVFIN